MSKIRACFLDCQQKQRKALIPFITAGDPNPTLTVPLMHALVEAGADILELGVPFSDPMADGPVIQRASERALKYHVSLKQVFEMVKEFRTQNTKTPIVLMGYLNPLEAYTYQRVAKDAADAGVDGFLIVDLPPEEAETLVKPLQQVDIDMIFLIAPTTQAERIAKIAQHASGFIYYVSVKGVTGSKDLDIQGVSDKLTEIRQHTDLPLGVGFGIKNAETAAKVAQVADAVIVGSALVQLIENIEENQIIATLSQTLADIRRGIDNR
jgi:tryptophan synthase alpha chain